MQRLLAHFAEGFCLLVEEWGGAGGVEELLLIFEAGLVALLIQIKPVVLVIDDGGVALVGDELHSHVTLLVIVNHAHVKKLLDVDEPVRLLLLQLLENALLPYSLQNHLSLKITLNSRLRKVFVHGCWQVHAVFAIFDAVLGRVLGLPGGGG